MKGSLPFYFNLLVMMIITVTFLYDKVITYDKSLQIAAASTKLYTTENSAEAMTRSLEAEIDFFGRQAIAELGVQGKWDKDSPKLEDLKKDFSEKVKEKLNSFSPALTNKNSVEWGASSISVNFENGLEISGSKPFTLKTSGGNAVALSESGKFREQLDSDFFKAASAGRDFFDDGLWIVSEEARNAGGDFCKGKISGAATNGFLQTNIPNLLNTSLYCGYRSTAGLASMAHYNKADAEAAVKDILNSLTSDLDTKYGIQIQLTPEITEVKDGSNYVVNLKINFKSENSQFLVPVGEKDFAKEKLEFFAADNFKIPE